MKVDQTRKTTRQCGMHNDGRSVTHAKNLDVEMACYTYGQRPDTIFNFGWSQNPLYMEINYSGRLNLKMSLDASISVDKRREAIEREIKNCENLPFSIAPGFHLKGKIGRSKTIASFEVGLIDSARDGYLDCQPSIDYVIENIYSVVKTFYGRKATA